jgi:hypothetical protein
MTVVKVFDARAHTIYIAKILWAQKLYIGNRSVYEPYWAVIVVGYPIIGLGLSAFNYRIIHIRRISLTPYPNLHQHTIGFGLSTSTWILKTLLHIHTIRILIGSDAEIIHTAFIPSRLHRPQQALPQGPLRVARIDQVIYSTTGCDMLCFLNCYSGYHQIAIKEEDQEKTVAILDRQTYQGGTRGSRLCGEDRDRETENSKVCART